MKKAALGLLVVGLLQMTGDLLHLPALKGIGAASGASPAPKVFTAQRGMESYTTRFFLEWTDRSGAGHELQLTPELYRRIEGPYNRRNVYGAVLAAGPILATDPKLSPLYRGVSHYALCGRAPLLREMGINPAEIAGPVRVRYEPLPGTTMGELPHVLGVKCE